MNYPDKQAVLDFIRDNPDKTTKRDIAKGLKVKGQQRQRLRAILRELESGGDVKRSGKREWSPADADAARPLKQQADKPPATGIIEFEGIDEHGDLIGRASRGGEMYGPPVRYTGYDGKHRQREPGPGDRALCKITRDGEEWVAKAIRVFEKREGAPLIGLFERGPRGGKVVSANRRDKREFTIREADLGCAEDGDLVSADAAPSRGRGPRFGIIKEIIGNISDPRSASLLAIYAHDIPTEFPEAALKQAREAVPAQAKRVDLTTTPLITIDPHDARDHDDAVFAERLKDGWRVIVAIADVAAYVTPDSALDKEALRRGNSTYFPDRVVPMLPFELSADACSLKEGEERCCIAVEMEFDTSGTKRKHRFMRAKMKSRAGISYEEAQAAIDGKPGGKAAEILGDVLKPLWGAYAALSKARDRRGPLDLDLPERKIEFNAEGEIDGIITKERLEAHRLIEEMMIQANVAAAESLEKAGQKLVYRVHDTPSDSKIAALAEFLKTIEIKWPIGERAQTHRFNRLLGDVADTELQLMVTQMVLRSQAQAVYSKDNLGHFGLNLARYAHFTSPIRRYADLIVHRALITALDLGPDGLAPGAEGRLEEIAGYITETERRSMAAEREATDRYLALFLADKEGVEFEGRITGVTGAGLFVQLAETGADGFVPISKLGESYWRHDEGAMALVAADDGREFRLGQIVRVKLLEVSPLQGGLLLEMRSDPRPARKNWTPSGDRRGRGGARKGRPGGPSGKKGKRKKSTTPKHKRKAKAKAKR